MFFSFIVACCLGVLCSVESHVSYKNAKVLEVIHSNTSLFQEFVQTSSDIVVSGLGVSAGDKKSYNILVSEESLPRVKRYLDSHGFEHKVIVEDFQSMIDEENPSYSLRGQSRSNFTWNAYHDIDEIHDYLKSMSGQYSTMASLIKYGRSHEGRDLLAIKIRTNDNNSSKRVIVIESGIHAREWISTATTLYLIRELLTSSNPEIIAMRNDFEWHIIPSTNPDGYHYSFREDRMWRKSRRPVIGLSTAQCVGVDLNRNWAYKFNTVGVSVNPCHYSIYNGPSAFSEPETSSLSKYLSKIGSIHGYIAYHSYGGVLLLPYSTSSEHKENYEDMKRYGMESFKRGYAVNNASYRAIGTAEEVIGYAVSGGSMDYVKATYRPRVVGTFELRGNSFIWPASRIEEQGEEVVQMLIGLLKAADGSA